MTEGIQVKLEADDINKYLSTAIAESLIGEHVKKAVDEVIKDVSKVNYWDKNQNPFYNTIFRLVEVEITKAINGQYSDMIKEVVAEHVTQEFTADLFKKLFESWVSRY